MIRSVLTLRTNPDSVEPIFALYRSEDILQESLNLTRALASEISASVDGTGEIIVTALWPDEAAYQEWIDHPNRGRTAPALSALLSNAEIGVAKLYRIDHGVQKHVAE